MIPLRVLQVAAHAQELGIYQDLNVWHEKTRPTDPLLIGVTHDWKRHILARWGSALAPFDELYQSSIKQTIEDFEVKATRRIAELKQLLENLKVTAIDHLNGGFVNI